MEQKEAGEQLDPGADWIRDLYNQRQSFSNEQIVLKLKQLRGERDVANKNLRDLQSVRISAESIGEPDTFSINEIESKLEVQRIEFRLALFGSRFDPEAYQRFLFKFQLEFSDLSEEGEDENGISSYADFYRQVGEKYGLLNLPKPTGATLDSPNTN